VDNSCRCDFDDFVLRAISRAAGGDALTEFVTTTDQNLREDDEARDEAVAAMEHPLHEPELPEIDDFGEPVSELVKIPTRDNGEKLVDIFRICPALKWAHQSPRWDFPRSGLARESVAQMLKNAQEALPSGLHLQIIGVFRPFEIQKLMYEKAREELREQHPHWDDEFLTRYLNVFSAPPIWDTPPPHTTGGAVDLLIVDDEGERLDFISPFEMGWTSAPTMMPGLSGEARKNRDLLIEVLTNAGLTNFPGEWWHWSYGEPGWALRGGHEAALYGAVPDEEIPDWQPPSEG
jgi:D-alanyl-D-alanine dipeptidase